MNQPTLPGASSPATRVRRLFALTLLVSACGSASCCTTQKVQPTPGATMHNPTLPGAPSPSTEMDVALRAAIAPGAVPRTHHLQPDGGATFVNRLIHETSPYLLQHAHNPVNWFPWGDEAFVQARATNRPVLLSIGYSTCHWCHVMERESFEDLEIAAYINAHFIPIKVDREERPDLDDTYMAAVQLLTGRGGWPMTVLLTPDKEPFFGGTYFPPRDGARGAGKGFLTILRELDQVWTKEPTKVQSAAAELSKSVREAAAPAQPAGMPGPELLHRTAAAIARGYDPQWGGFGGAPKFPRPVTLDFLLRYHRRTGDPKSLEMVSQTLINMRAGGVFDQLGGAFHRYSTDRQWLVPHFEKMLYDNAQLVPVYLCAWQLTGRDDLLDTVRLTLEAVQRDFTAPEGGFFSATDADSRTADGHEEEGAFFTWTPAELNEVLGPEDGARAAATWGVEGPAPLDGRWVLHRPTPRSDARLEPSLDALRAKLFVHRATRPPPHLDDKILTSWNGLMISAFARAALVTGEPKYLASARNAADFVLTKLRTKDGKLLRSYRAGQAQVTGFLDDYAFLEQGCLDLLEATGEVRWLDEARRLQAVLDADFADEQHGGYFMTAKGGEALLRRERPTYDGAEPSGNSVALLNLQRLATWTDDDAYRTRASAVLEGLSTVLQQQAQASPLLLSGLEAALDVPVEVFIVSPSKEANVEPLLAVVRKSYLPNRVFLSVVQGQVQLPVLEGKVAQGGAPTAYVCERGQCELPTKDPQVFAAQLARVRKPLQR